MNSIGRAVNQILRYVSVLILVKYLGTINYGYLTIGFTILSIGVILSNFGLNYGVFRFVPIFLAQNEISKVKGVISFCIRRVAIYAIIVAIVMFFGAELIAINIFNKPPLVDYIQLFSIAIPFSVLSTMIFHIFKGFSHINYKILIEDILILIVRIILYLFCLYFGLSAMGIVISYSISLLIGLIAGIYFLIKIFPQMSDKKIKPEINISEITKYSYPLFLSSFLAIFLNRTDILMLSYYLPADQIAIYSISHKLAILVFFIANATFAIFTPTMAKFFAKAKLIEMNNISIRIVYWVSIVTIPLFLSITLFSEDLLGFFGRDFVVGKTALIILSVSFLLNSLLGFAGQLLGVLGKSKVILINSLMAGILNIILNFVLVPHFGIIGAACATAFSIFAVNLARAIEVYIFDKFFFLSFALLKLFTVGLFIGGFILQLKNLFFYKNSLIFFIGFNLLSIGLYLFLIWIFVLSPNDKDLIYSFFNAKNKKQSNY